MRRFPTNPNRPFAVCERDFFPYSLNIAGQGTDGFGKKKDENRPAEYEIPIGYL